MNKWLEEKQRKLRKEFLSEYKNFHDIDVSKAEFLIKEAIDGPISSGEVSGLI